MGKMKSAPPRSSKGKAKSIKRTKLPKSAKGTALTEPVVLTPEQQARLDAFRAYVAMYSTDESGEQEKSWKQLKKDLDDYRTSYRKHFSD